MSWISVEDGLPPIGTAVFTIGIFNDKPATNHVVAQLDNDGKWLVGYTLNGDRYVLVVFETFPTHWMPLPPPPKGES
ncbi:MAG: DUF551 domain-containing protein [Acinetobacter sp.]